VCVKAINTLGISVVSLTFCFINTLLAHISTKKSMKIQAQAKSQIIVNHFSVQHIFFSPAQIMRYYERLMKTGTTNFKFFPIQ
jgi:dihydroorotase-like cyclic amidohydrolase